MAYFEKTQITDTNDVTINPATDESILFLRRLLKVMESQSVVDVGGRQRVTVDTLPAIPTGANVIGAVNINAGQTLATVTTVSNITQLFSWNQQILSDPARTAYNTGIRSQLTFA